MWKEYFPKGSTIFITGGTGFFGKWLLETFIYINEKMKLDGKIIVLSRNPDRFLKEYPQFKNTSVRFLKGDIRTFIFPKEKIDFIIHAANESSVKLNVEEPILMYDTIVEGTKKILEFSRKKNVKAILHTSSGAVYGKQPSELSHIKEEFAGCPDIYSKNAAYGEGKRVAEMLCNFYLNQYNVQSKIARCFAFTGPYLPLDGHFAIGNFIKNCLETNTIKIQGDGTTYRSYMYTSDLCIWLWTILFKATACRPYNVGSEEAINIESVAKIISSFTNKKMKIKIAQKKKNISAERYVSSNQRAVKELGLQQFVSQKEALQKTFNYYKNESK